MDPTHPSLSINKQCEFLKLSKGSLCYQPVRESAENLKLTDLIDRQYLKTPFYGSRRMAAFLKQSGYRVNRKRVQRLMRIMGMEAIYPKPKTSNANKEHFNYPYLLKNVEISSPNHVWSSDITYLRPECGFICLTAIIDWFSRYVLSWKLSNSPDSGFCVETLEEALNIGTPQIFNTDQGAQYTARRFLDPLKAREIRISMDSKGRAIDNIFLERLWRSLKYEEVYLKSYRNISEAEEAIESYFLFYNHERLHQSLGYQTPENVYFR